MAQPLVRNLSAGLLLAVCSAAMGIENVPGNDAGRALVRAFPGVNIHEEAGRVTSIYGVPMTAGQTPRAAAEAWIAQYSGVFGAGQLSLTEAWSSEIQEGRFTVFTYDQNIGGAPVEYGMLKVLVLNGQTPRVAYAAGTLAAAPGTGLNAAVM